MSWCGCTVYIEWISCEKWSMSFRTTKPCPTHNTRITHSLSYTLNTLLLLSLLLLSTTFTIIFLCLWRTTNTLLPSRLAAWPLGTFTPTRSHSLPVPPPLAGDNWRVKLMPANPEKGPVFGHFPHSRGLSLQSRHRLKNKRETDPQFWFDILMFASSATDWNWIWIWCLCVFLSF